jgi:chromosome segregation ATPase
MLWSMSWRFGSGLVVVALVAVALSGCGSNDEAGSNDGTTTSGESSSLDGWAQGLCTSIGFWQENIKSMSAKMATSQADFAEAQEAVTSANDALAESLKGLGAPPAPATTKAQDAIDELSNELEDTAGEIEQELNKSFTTQTEIAKASARTSALLSEMNSDISKTVTELKSLPDEEGWKEAFEQVPACQAVAIG